MKVEDNYAELRRVNKGLRNMSVNLVDNRTKAEYSFRAFGYEIGNCKLNGIEYDILAFAEAIEIRPTKGDGKVYCEIPLRPMMAEAIKLLQDALK